MGSEFRKLADAEPAIVSAAPQERAPHTTAPNDARRMVSGYLAFLNRIADFRLPATNLGLDLGAGAGHIAEAFNEAGCRMIAAEHTDEGVALIRSLSPGIEALKKNVADFREPGKYDLIFSREIYPFTRINAYDEQRRAVSNIIDSLKSGGAFLLSASDVCAPDCLDYDRLIKELRADSRLRLVTGKHYEFIFKRWGGLISGPQAYRLFELAVSPLILYKRWRHGFARIYLIAFVKI